MQQHIQRGQTFDHTLKAYTQYLCTEDYIHERDKAKNTPENFHQDRPLDAICQTCSFHNSIVSSDPKPLVTYPCLFSGRVMDNRDFVCEFSRAEVARYSRQLLVPEVRASHDITGNTETAAEIHLLATGRCEGSEGDQGYIIS